MLYKLSHHLKAIFKGAVLETTSIPGPFQDFYQALLAKGSKPTMARLTVARKIAAIILTAWKTEVSFDANHLKQRAV